MTARDILSPKLDSDGIFPQRNIDARMPLLDVLPALVDAPSRRLGVTDGDRFLGVIDSDSLLDGLSRFIAARDDCSFVEVVCSPADYSAAAIAAAVEDSDTHVVDLLSAPDPDDPALVRVTLRVRASDPSAAAASLERHGFCVDRFYGAESRAAEVAAERLLELKTIFNI